MKTSSTIEITDQEDYEEIKLWKYQYLISKLMYLAYSTRPNIAFIVSQLSKYNADPRKGHLWVAKRVVRYLKETIEMGLVFERVSANGWLFQDLPSYDLIAYTDSNFAGNPED